MANTTYGGNPYGSNPSGKNPYGTNPYGTNLDYGSNSARTIADQQRRQNAAQYAQGTAQQQQVADYLSPIESNLAEGKGGYNADELSQIQMTPQQQQDIVTRAGISAGTNTAASVDAANRAAAAAGGSPSAVMAYRARAGRQIGQQAGDAMTDARVAASNAAAQREENVGQARMGQQNQGLGYFNSLQDMYNSNAQNAANRQEQASQLGLQASQTPSTFDKIMGGVSGAVSGGILSHLEAGAVSGKTTPAVVGENGPEKVVDVSRPGLEDGGIPSLLNTPNSADYLATVNSSSVNPAFTRTATNNPDGSVTVSDPGGSSPMGFLQRLKNSGLLQATGAPGQQNQPSPSGNSQPQSSWNPVSTYQGLGQDAAKAASMLEDGGVASDQGINGIFTKPTRVNLRKNEAVVPLNYRAGAKVRPSLAALPAAHVRQAYGGARAHI